MFSFLAGAGAMAYLVLAAYDVLLVYNLGHARTYAVGAPLALVIAVVAAYAAPRVDAFGGRALGGPGTSEGVELLRSSLAAFALIFFIPSLVIRYLSFHPVAAACALSLVVTGAVIGLVRTAKARALEPRAVVRLGAAAGVAVIVGGVAAMLAVEDAHAAIGEFLLARAAAVFLGTATITLRAVEGAHRALAASP